MVFQAKRPTQFYYRNIKMTRLTTAKLTSQPTPECLPLFGSHSNSEQLYGFLNGYIYKINESKTCLPKLSKLETGVIFVIEY